MSNRPRQDATTSATTSATPLLRRRHWLARCGGALLGGAALTACGTRSPQALRPAGADGTYCQAGSAGEADLRTCLPGPLPTAEQQAEARWLRGDAQRLTVVVIRQRWADAVNRVSLDLDGRAVADTLPSSFVRLRMAPGAHVLGTRWPVDGAPGAAGKSGPSGPTAAAAAQATLALTGQAGEVLCVELVGSVWLWRTQYRLEATTPAQAAERVRALRLVADVG